MTRLLALAALLALALLPCQAAEPLNVGSKRFTESYLLAELVRQTAAGTDEGPVLHKPGLGNTAILLGALRAGSIDLYPEYTGTIARDILQLPEVPPLPELNARLAALGLQASVPLGFNNSYGLAVRAAQAEALGITRLSQLRQHPTLRYGLSQEFMGRADGWPGLQQAYGLAAVRPRGLDHGLAYEALAQQQVDVIDIYTTDAKLTPYNLRVLVDDMSYFPRYEAVLLHRTDLPARHPQRWAGLQSLQGRISEEAMRRMNAAAELAQQPFANVAAQFLAGATATTSPAAPRPGFWQRLGGPDLWRLGLEHLALVFLSLGVSVVVGVPLGMLAARHPLAESLILGITGMLQTIPSLALLAILIPLTGRIGLVPAFIALSVYALLPIVRNTHAGLRQVPAGLRQAAQALGLSRRQTLTLVELPLATPTLLAGIKTSAVLNVGTATIAAFIGAGGYGERIVTGLALNDHALLLAGAIPVALLALGIEAAFRLGERGLLPAGWRLPR
ncbi:MAG: ABC transporter permease subunit [Hylemonella sp.]|uniref:ABC transporter permease/substrate-binding protein n=1 Tax=Hylemonella sp. TaxID=2066020 RepID=UPI0022BE46FA|nr:glycine betaine ABC transporter substrate-binding protein [Hylemonella sp.]MCZ8251315.1 ABC transporter permease subunit [Hylemonella sp.]